MNQLTGKCVRQTQHANTRKIKNKVIYWTIGEFGEKYSWTACKIRQLRLFCILISNKCLIPSLYEWGRDFDLVYLTFNCFICIMVNIMKEKLKFLIIRVK